MFRLLQKTKEDFFKPSESQENWERQKLEKELDFLEGMR